MGVEKCKAYSLLVGRCSEELGRQNSYFEIKRGNNTRQYLKPSAKLCDLDYKCYQNCALCVGVRRERFPGGAADRGGLENKVGFHSA